MVPSARFREFLADIEPAPTTTTAASSAHSSVRKHVRSHSTFKDPWLDDFLAGSYSRDTAIRPKTTEDGYERPDVDIIVDTRFRTPPTAMSATEALYQSRIAPSAQRRQSEPRTPASAA